MEKRPTEPCPLCGDKAHHLAGRDLYRFDCPTCGRFVIANPFVFKYVMDEPRGARKLQTLSEIVHADQKGEDHFTHLTLDIVRHPHPVSH